MNEMSLNEQIQRLKEMKSYLENFSQEMIEVMEYFQEQIINLKKQGLSIETADTYLQCYYTPADSSIEQIVNDIRSRHIEYINRVIELLEKINR